MKQTCLYRHYNEHNILLYVGISSDHHLRFQAHLKFAEWKNRITKVLIERFPTREDATRAEITAIQTEHPLYNVQHQVKGSIGYTLKRLLPLIELQDMEEWEEECEDECNEIV